MSDRPSVEGPGLESALETELRAVLSERSAGITTATLLRPDPPGLETHLPRRPVPRWRMVGAFAAVSVVILAVVLGRGVMAPQEQTAVGAATPSAAYEPWFNASRLTNRLWGATSIVWSGVSVMGRVEPSGSRVMVVEFASDGTVVFHDGNNEVRGRYSTDATSVIVSGAGGWVPTSVSRTDTYFQETAALGALLDGMPAPVTLKATLIGSELTLVRGEMTIRYELSGVTPAVAAADPTQYLLGAAVGHSWRATTVGPPEDRQPVPSGPVIRAAIGADGWIRIDEAGATLEARWWATPSGLVTVLTSGTGNSAFDGGTGTSAREAAVNAVHAAVLTLTDGFGTFSLSTDGTTLTVLPSQGPQVPVTFVRE